MTLDIQEMRSSMTLWRDTFVMCHTEAQHNRDLREVLMKLLNNLGNTLAGWLDLLKMCTAEGSEAADLQAITREVVECRSWARESLAAMYLIDTVQSLPRRDW